MNRDPRDPIVAELGDIGDETWMAKTIKEIKVGDIIVITENSSAMFPNNHFMDMAKALGKAVGPGVTVVCCTRGSTVEKLPPASLDHLVDVWLHTMTLQDQDQEMRQLADRLLQLAKRKKVDKALGF